MKVHIKLVLAEKKRAWVIFKEVMMGFSDSLDIGDGRVLDNVFILY